MRWRHLLLIAGVLPVLAGCGGASQSAKPAPTVSRAPGAQTTKPGPSGRAAAAVLDAKGALVSTLTGDGAVESAAADGRGGWFVAGAFTQLNGMAERGLARVRADGSVDPRWHAALRSSSPPALAASGTTLYAGGSIGDTDHPEFEALDPATASARAAPTLAPYPVEALAADGAELIVAQDTGAAPKAPSCLHGYDVRSGAKLPGFSAAIRTEPELGCINQLKLDRRRLYLAGVFQRVDGMRRAGLARLDAHTGALDVAWRPPVPSCRQPGLPRGRNGCDGLAYDVAVAPGRVFVGGFRPGVSALSERTGATDQGWHAPGGIENALRLAVLGGRLFVGGDFRGSGATVLHGFAALNVSDGSLLTSWHPPRSARALSVTASASRLLVGLSAAG